MQQDIATQPAPIRKTRFSVRLSQAFTVIGRAKNALGSLPERAVSDDEWRKTEKTAKKLEEIAIGQHSGLMKHNAALLFGMAAEAYEKLKVSYSNRTGFFNNPETMLKIIRNKKNQGICLKDLNQLKESADAFEMAISKSFEYIRELGYLANLEGEKPDAKKINDARFELSICLNRQIEVLEKLGNFDALEKACRKLGEICLELSAFWKDSGNLAAADTEKRAAEAAFRGADECKTRVGC